MATWPVSLPQLVLVDGFAWSPEANVVGFSTEVGPGKARRRSTARSARLTPTIVVTQTQLTTFRTFFETTLQDGALPFDWIDPTTASAASFRFSVTDTPYSLSRQGNRWRVSMSLMRLP